jgi:hypothetical protein
MSMIAIITDPGVGGTFLTWSLHFLAGHTDHFDYKSQVWKKLTHNPVTKINAHGFAPNQSTNLEGIQQCLLILSNIPTDNFHTIYFHNISNFNSWCPDTHIAVQHTMSQCDKTIVLCNQEKNNLYHVRQESRILTHKLRDITVKNNSWQEQHEDFILYFFKESLDYWKQQNLNQVWDYREFLALNLRPFNFTSILPYVDRKLDHYELDCMELYTMFDSTVDHLFSYLNLKIDADRKQQWQIVYDKWKKIHQNRLNFLYHFDKIISCILDGYYLDLTRFELDIVQEACIQHKLIYDHNLNLKTWNLDKFNNTQQLHQLLETNHHPINNI